MNRERELEIQELFKSLNPPKGWTLTLGPVPYSDSLVGFQLNACYVLQRVLTEDEITSAYYPNRIIIDNLRGMITKMKADLGNV